uniref:ATP synthase subunit a n=1 Tax=Leiodon cutcutia TaxID=591948 RepID=F2EMR0_LEICU|nr:ATP synthase F0 subunit 6 [Leiodon cutcutia]BAK09878.1 ATPase subunit 6 [Leiodon cutcutia]BCM23404.1 ATP synthase F0 subunit 6 [Leiodon cutcutia]
MTPSLFHQFLSPTYFGIPMIALALMFPLTLLPTSTSRWAKSRLLMLQGWFINRFAKQLLTPLNMGGHKWALILSSLMVMLMSLNMLGLLPYTFTPTTQLSLNMALAVPLWLMTVIIGMRKSLTSTLAHLLPEGTPALLIPALVIIETISLFIRPLALGVRLTANLTAGHLLMQLVSTATFTLLPIMPMTASLAGALLFLLTILEFAVAMIQAYVFVLLLSLYLQENV